MIKNVKVYGLENSFRVSRFPKAVNLEKCVDKLSDTIVHLAGTAIGSGHDNFLLGIVVQFDLTFSIKAWTEAERYHFFDIVSSQSTMHKLANMPLDDVLNEWVTDNTKTELKRLQKQFNDEPTSENYLTMLYNCPTGLKLTAGMTTNYRQLKTIYKQRKTHRLPEWREFCKWIETLPYAYLITGGQDNCEN